MFLLLWRRSKSFFWTSNTTIRKDNQYMDRRIFERKKFKEIRKINQFCIGFGIIQIKMMLFKKDTIHHSLFKEHLVCTLEHFTHQFELNQNVYKYNYMILLMLEMHQGYISGWIICSYLLQWAKQKKECWDSWWHYLRETNPLVHM